MSLTLGTLDWGTLMCPLHSLPSHIIGEGRPLIIWGCLVLRAIALPVVGTACCDSPPCQSIGEGARGQYLIQAGRLQMGVVWGKTVL